MITLYVICLFSVFLSIISSQKECFRITSAGVQTVCCDNHIRQNDVCVECEPGTISKNEEPCTTCSPGKYGRGCRYPCTCKILERCDNVIGCVINSVSSDNIEITGTPWNYSSIVTIKEGLSESEIVLYSAGSSGLLLLIIFVVVIYVFKSKSKHSQNNQKALHHDHRNSAALNETANDDNVYESIDESVICGDNFQNQDPQQGIEGNNNTKSESDFSSIKSENSGYLHPYTTFDERKETHLYCTRIKSGSNSTSPSLDNFKRDSGYTHPYQQLHKVDTELQKEQQSVYSGLVVNLELMSVNINRGNVSRTDLPNCKDPQRKSC